MKKAAILVLATLPPALITLGSAWAVQKLYQPQWAYAVVVEGKTIGYVKSPEEYSRIINNVQGRAEEFWGSQLVINEDYSARNVLKWYPQASSISTEAQAEAAFTYVASGWEIIINGKQVLVVESKEFAQELLDVVKNRYQPTGANRTLVSMVILDHVGINRIAIGPELVVSREEAMATILQGHFSGHTVRRGESLAAIARSHNMAVQELRKINPEVENDWLREGQILNISSPLLNVKTVETLETTESIPPPVRHQTSANVWYFQTRVIEAGTAGSRTVVYRIERVNGQEQLRAVVSQEITRQPTTRVVATGTAVWPSRETGPFRWPLNTGRITDFFGSFQSWRRQRHLGVDIGAPQGTPIYAAADGQVTFAGWGASGGWYIIIDHKNGYQTLYAHNSANLVSAGQWVKRGQVIGRVGSTGSATGPHVHFEVRHNGNFVDPMRFFAP
jgi:murein DD-endopeptidase MepM/ murein hydrolase activator NlpD